MNTLSIISLIFIFLGGVGAILLAIGQSISATSDKSDIIETLRSENRTLKSSLDSFRTENDTLKSHIEKRDAKVNAQNDTIISLHHKLSSESEYIKNFMTGGSGHPTITMKLYPKTEGQDQHFVFQVDNNFDYPIYNLEVEIFDYDAIKNKSYNRQGFQYPFIKLADYDNALVLKIIYNEIPPKEWRAERKKFTLKEGSYLAQIHARNCTLTEKIATVKQGKNYFNGFQIVNFKGKELEKSIDGNSPSVSKLIIDRLIAIPNQMHLYIEE